MEAVCLPCLILPGDTTVFETMEHNQFLFPENHPTQEKQRPSFPLLSVISSVPRTGLLGISLAIFASRHVLEGRQTHLLIRSMGAEDIPKGIRSRPEPPAHFE